MLCIVVFIMGDVLIAWIGAEPRGNSPIIFTESSSTPHQSSVKRISSSSSSSISNSSISWPLSRENTNTSIILSNLTQPNEPRHPE
ncbi:Hypothetical protein FKW44_021495 [Caligus rogercresseyi]|uniref:Secreted protein n=1 Tax=Caligus rogercresseyi TaxID=217165 RepID=A0A7T8GRT2_CALRO|nr:Hypothetical protein FKW44_021495 [Caligus rogercresseyi]